VPADWLARPPEVANGRRIRESVAVSLRSKTLLATCVAACVLAAAAVAAATPGARYVLTSRDVGPAYARNDTVSGGRSLADVSVGDSARIRRELRQSWLGGTVAAFNAVSGARGVISIADVFRQGAPIAEILRAWQADAARVTHGAFEPLPGRAPGDHPALVRGKILSYEVLVYMWSRGRTIASVEVTGKPGETDRGFLLSLARRQDAKLAAS